MHAAFLAYLLTLGVILALGVKTHYLRWGLALVAIFLLIWTDLILSAQLLSPFSAIYVTSAYVVASLAIAPSLCSLTTGGTTRSTDVAYARYEPDPPFVLGPMT